MDYLARRDHSEKELVTKLSQRGYHFEEIQKGLDYVRNRGWLFPADELALKYTESLHQKGKSFQYIRKQLLQKGLPVPSYDLEREVEKVHEHLQKKFPSSTGYSWQQKEDILRYLKNRAFDDTCIRKAIDESGRNS